MLCLVVYNSVAATWCWCHSVAVFIVILNCMSATSLDGIVKILLITLFLCTFNLHFID